MTGDLQGSDPKAGVRDGLRTLRHVVRQGRMQMRDFGPDRLLPEPLSGHAREVLERVDSFALAVGRRTEDAIRRFVQGAPQSPRPLTALSGDHKAAEEFAAAIYVGLQEALGALDAEDTLILESAAQSAYRAAKASDASDQDMFAAVLHRQLLASRTVCDVAVVGDIAIPPRDIPAVAIFAVLLWLICDRDGTGDAELVAACTSLARSLASEIATATRDDGAMAQLFAEFRHHV